MSLTDAVLVLAAVTFGAAAIIATSLDSLRRSLIDSLRAILTELEWLQNGTGTEMRRRTERDMREAQDLERELPSLAALGLLPHLKPLVDIPRPASTASVPSAATAGPSTSPSVAQSL